MSKEDARIVASILDGQVDAYGLLIDKYAEPLFRYITIMLGYGDDRIEDICQEALTAGFAGIATLSNQENFRGWLFGIAANKVKSEFRQRRKDREIQKEAMLSGELTAPDADEGALEEARIKATVQKGLSGLSEEMREVITMKYFSNLSYEEIAEALDIPKSTVRGRMYRAYQSLRDSMKDS